MIDKSLTVQRDLQKQSWTMADDTTPAADNKSDDCDNQAVTADDGSMPLTPKSAKYEPLRSLCDLKTTRDLTNDGVRDLLRRYTRDHGLEVVRLGALEDMSGLNDAFNRYRLFDN